MTFSQLLKTHPRDNVALFQRLVLALVIFPHGAQKALGWFGGGGFAGTMDFFTIQMGIPSFLAFLAILAEFVGGILLVFGLLGRVAAFGIAVNMVVATLLVHLPHGFFMNWGGTQAGEGFEFHLLALALAVGIVIRGSGAFSLDSKFFQKLEPTSRIDQRPKLAA